MDEIKTKMCVWHSAVWIIKEIVVVVLIQIASPGDNSTRSVITFDEDDEAPKYTQVVIYDHITRRKT